MKSCSFFGHRKIEETEELKIKLYNIIETLILENGVEKFLFGSKSEFNGLCYDTVSTLKEKHPNIIRISYDTKSELSMNREEKIKMEETYFKVFNKKISFNEYEGSIKPDCVFVSGKASYIERNQKMVDDSDYCVFYYNENYKPETKTVSRKYSIITSDKSGTAIIYKYAKSKKKIIINLFENENK